MTGYGLAALVVGLAFGLRYLVEPALDEHVRYLFFVPAVLVAGVLGGFGPGCLATAASIALSLGLIWPNIDRAGWISAAAFAAIGLGVSWFGDRLQRTRARAEATGVRDTFRGAPGGRL